VLGGSTRKLNNSLIEYPFLVGGVEGVETLVAVEDIVDAIDETEVTDMIDCARSSLRLITGVVLGECPLMDEDRL
jgi:hypothetical protein